MLDQVVKEVFFEITRLDWRFEEKKEPATAIHTVRNRAFQAEGKASAKAQLV